MSCGHSYQGVGEISPLVETLTTPRTTIGVRQPKCAGKGYLTEKESWSK